MPVFAIEQPVAQEKPNVLFIMIDDMRVTYGPYAKQGPKTPNIDKLANTGVAFNRAYSNIPVCGASRASLMTGIRGSKDRFLAFSPADVDTPDAISLAQHFKSNGYTTVSLGKVFNNQNDKKDGWHTNWRPDEALKLKGKNNQKANLKIRMNYQTAEANKVFDDNKKGPAFEIANVDDFQYFNGQIAKRATQELETFKKNKQPFFMAVGLKKPHLPFNSPQKYWDMYNHDELPVATSNSLAKDAPKNSSHSWGELRSYYGMPKKGAMPADLAKQLVHGYFAATSYSDALVGLIVDTLSELELDENTIIVLWGDHGWSLGEHGLWAKHSAYSVANQIPLIFNGPALLTDNKVEGIVESVDIYPTLVELANLPKVQQVDGVSLVPQLTTKNSKGKNEIFTRWKNSDSIRTNRFHYTEWRNKQDKVIARMLFDHDNDPEELVNVAEHKKYQNDVENLSVQLQQQIHIANKS
ncbi:sulfatase [Thalassotalea psychrophila]|uniref:Sulfatase n=1 Tax=Thalassotalea psychrophila TaxID=3065647 RepID=A0ABY9TXM6_9GAMM|nr:sulfatase [Colwelliaceae bacterium SQ149]